jgi:molybdate transport system ATP-binding protein
MNAGNEFVIHAENIIVNRGSHPVLQGISFDLKKGEHLAITGNSGSGKTTLGLALAGKTFFRGEITIAPWAKERIAWIEQQHHFKNLSNTGDFYYQQRFNSADAEDALTVVQSLEPLGGDIETVMETMKINHLADEPLIQLSNGENKKLQLAGALLQRPTMLIMDQPFIGLDKSSREDLHHSINKLAEQGIVIILITTPDEIPACISNVIKLGDNKTKQFSFNKDLLPPGNDYLFDYAIRMNHINITYGERKILQDINWEVKKGERWLLSGPNGAGKSTLLSLVNADNPQGYANEIYLFDKKRGTGESIWDIKRKIGYLSPELHLFFDHGCNAFEAVASGLFDTIGLFRQLSDEQIQLVNDWMKTAGVDHLRQKRLFELSAGEQRVVLLVRALVKDPPLLILDEPCQGLDKEKQTVLLELIDAVCVHGNKTMVFVTHYANDKPQCIDKFISLENGKRVQ